MSVNFFEATCRKTASDIKFGLCDDDNTEPAFIDTDHEDDWIATVINSSAKVVSFTAIDNCIEILRDNGDMDSRCDVMLNYRKQFVVRGVENKKG